MTKILPEGHGGGGTSGGAGGGTSGGVAIFDIFTDAGDAQLALRLSHSDWTTEWRGHGSARTLAVDATAFLPISGSTTAGWTFTAVRDYAPASGADGNSWSILRTQRQVAVPAVPAVVAAAASVTINGLVVSRRTTGSGPNGINVVLQQITPQAGFTQGISGQVSGNTVTISFGPQHVIGDLVTAIAAPSGSGFLPILGDYTAALAPGASETADMVPGSGTLAGGADAAPAVPAIPAEPITIVVDEAAQTITLTIDAGDTIEDILNDVLDQPLTGKFTQDTTGTVDEATDTFDVPGTAVSFSGGVTGTPLEVEHNTGTKTTTFNYNTGEDTLDDIKTAAEAEGFTARYRGTTSSTATPEDPTFARTIGPVTVAVAGSGGGGGGLTEAQVDSRIRSNVKDFAEVGGRVIQTGDIGGRQVTEDKLAQAVVDQLGGTGGLTEAQVDARVTAGVKDFAETGSTTLIATADIANEAVTQDKLAAAVVALLGGGGGGGLTESEVDARVRAGVADWAEEGNNQQLPKDKQRTRTRNPGLFTGLLFPGNISDMGNDTWYRLPSSGLTGDLSGFENGLIFTDDDGVTDTIISPFAGDIFIEYTGDLTSTDVGFIDKILIWDDSTWKDAGMRDFLRWRGDWTAGTYLRGHLVAHSSKYWVLLDHASTTTEPGATSHQWTEFNPVSTGGGGGTGLSNEDKHRLSLIPGLDEKTHDLVVDELRTWSDAPDTTNVEFSLTDSEPEVTADVSGLTFGAETVTLTSSTASNEWLVWKIAETGVDPRNYRLRLDYPSSGGTFYVPAAGETFIADGTTRYLKVNINSVDGLTLTLEVDTVTESTHYRGNVDAAKVLLSATNLTDRLSGAANAQAALDILDGFEIVDITDGALPAPAAGEAGKLFLHRVHKTVSFLTEDQIAQTAPTGNFEVYDSNDAATYLGTHSGDPNSQVGNSDTHLNKFYWNWNRHTFRYWTREQIFGTAAYHWYWKDVHNTGSFLADREGFDHADSDIHAYWLGYADTDALLREHIPDDIADGSRAYGVRLNSDDPPTDGVIGVRKIDGSDFTAGVNGSTIYGYSILSIAGASGVTVAALNTAIDELRSELRGGVAAGRDTMDELSDAIDALVTDTNLNVTTPANESTSVGASRQAIAEAIAAVGPIEEDLRVSQEDGIDTTGVLLRTTAAFARRVVTQVDLGEDIDANAQYQFVMNLALSTRPAQVTPAVAGSILLNDSICPVQATAPANPHTAVDLKIGRTVNNANTSFSHDELYVWRRSANSLWVTYAESNSPTTNTVSVFKIPNKVFGVTYTRIEDGAITMGGTNAGESNSTAITGSGSKVLGYPATITSVTMEHGTTTTLMVRYTTRAPDANDRPAGLDLFGYRWAFANATVTANTASGLSTIDATFAVPATLADSAADVEAIRSPTAYTALWLVANDRAAGEARLPAVPDTRTTNAIAQFDATNDQWGLADVAMTQTSEQQDMGTYTRAVRVISTGGTISLVNTNNRYNGTLGTQPSMNIFNVESIHKDALVAIQIQIRVQNRWDMFEYIPREMIEQIGYVLDASWNSDWHSSNSTIVPGIFFEWEHGTGEFRGRTLARPNYYHIEAARQADINGLLVFFRHNGNSDDHLRGIGIIAVSDSNLLLTRAQAVYNSAIQFTGS